jgi:molybdate transport system substrate-binding protein
VKIKTFSILILIVSWLLAGCAGQPAGTAQSPNPSTSTGSVDLNVFAAASLTEPFGEIGKLFESKHPGVQVILNFAGSQQLAQQINQGAPADVFASANNLQMKMVIQAGGIVSGTQESFVKNRLVVIYPKNNPAGLKQLEDLAKPGLKLVFAAKDVPVGQYTLQFLHQAMADPAFGSSYQNAVIKNVVSYEDNVKAVLAKVALGEADAGIVYTSDISGEDANNVGRLDIPDALNVIARYPIAPVKASKNPELAQAFIDLVLSPQGQNILAKYNFIPAASPPEGSASASAEISGTDASGWQEGDPFGKLRAGSSLRTERSVQDDRYWE